MQSFMGIGLAGDPIFVKIGLNNTNPFGFKPGQVIFFVSWKEIISKFAVNNSLLYFSLSQSLVCST